MKFSVGQMKRISLQRWKKVSVISISYHIVKVKNKLENMLSQTTKPSKVADKCLRLREER